MIKVLAARGDQCQELPEAEINAQRLQAGDFTWIDIHDPQPADLDLLHREFRVHDLVIEDIAKQHQRPKIDEYEGYYFLVMYTADRSGSTLELTELDIILGHDYLITIHDRPIDEIAAAQDRWQSHPEMISRGPGDLLYIILDAIIDEYFPCVDDLSDRVDEIEQAVLSASVKRPVREIFALRRDTARFRRVIGPERDVINALLRRETAQIDEYLTVYYQDLYDHVIRVIEQVDAIRDLLSSALDAHLAYQSNRLNTTMRQLTAWTIILMSVTLIAGIYGMNFEYMPELSWLLGYPWALGLMVGTGLAIYSCLRKADWL
ncbi:MAG TPA: magnesium/cobalt transporter CorA [Dehalococcoidia bacterium]|nr:magnesium/cobalt transporter CorA [Dehalococcoidia bacterium]